MCLLLSLNVIGCRQWCNQVPGQICSKCSSHCFCHRIQMLEYNVVTKFYADQMSEIRTAWLKTVNQCTDAYPACCRFLRHDQRQLGFIDRLCAVRGLCQVLYDLSRRVDLAKDDHSNDDQLEIISPFSCCARTYPNTSPWTLCSHCGQRRSSCLPPGQDRIAGASCQKRQKTRI